MSSIIRTINGQQVTFPRVRVKEKLLLIDMAYEVRRQALFAERKEGEDITESLNDLRSYKGDPALLWKWCWTMSGAIEVIGQVNAEFDLESISDPFDFGFLAADICGFDLSDVKKVKTDAGKDKASPERDEDESRPTSPPSGTT